MSHNHKQVIISLDKKTVDKIAAGEVIERPASVVKELVENSIDANATEISIFLKDYGLEEIRVIDNGCGMSREDATIAWKSHTTSKLKNVEDLDSLSSLGFRGEALASIAAVSMMELLTRRKDQKTGTVVRVRGSDLELIDEKECAPGTIVTIKNLFYNVPARKKFLKSKTTELGHIIEIVTRVVLIRPDIHFKLQHEATVLLNSPKSNNQLDPFIAVFGIELAKRMIPVDFEREGIIITGFTSLPDTSRSTRDYEMFYVNSRYVKSMLLSEATEEAYGTLLMKNQYPVTLLEIMLDASKIDVNIHPAKREIRFDDSKAIFNTVVDAITFALDSQQLWRESTSVIKKQTLDTMQHILPFEPIFDKSDETVVNSKQHSINQEEKSENSKYSSPTELSLIISESGKKDFVMLESNQRTIQFSNSFWLRPLGQVLKLYVLCESNEGIAIVDIHAAHERIRYEELLNKYQQSKIETQELLHPITFTLNPEQIAFMKEYIEHFKSLGFNPELFGGRTFVIRNLPIRMDLMHSKIDFGNLLDEIRKEIPKMVTFNERIDLIIKKMACHSVVRGGELIDILKIVSILKELSQCKRPFTCPHGRPTIIKISQKDLEREFKRII